MGGQTSQAQNVGENSKSPWACHAFGCEVEHAADLFPAPALPLAGRSAKTQADDRAHTDYTWYGD